MKITQSVEVFDQGYRCLVLLQLEDSPTVSKVGGGANVAEDGNHPMAWEGRASRNLLYETKSNSNFKKLPLSATIAIGEDSIAKSLPSRDRPALTNQDLPSYI